MATMVAVCSGLGRKKLTHLVMAAVSLTHPGTRMVLWRRGYVKNVQLLSQFISPFIGYIRGRHKTGLCGKKQKEITKAIKRPQIIGFMPVTYKDAAYLKDPTVCNIRYQE
uniref:Small ribosomal subunit protein bS18m n=1 Tax=Rhinopithecus roxellana TaxID=61622 RepID=A0A2K6P8J8_RHIRO